MERASLSQKTNIFQNSKILYGLRLTEIHILASMSNKRKGIGFGIVWFRDKYEFIIIKRIIEHFLYYKKQHITLTRHFTTFSSSQYFIMCESCVIYVPSNSISSLVFIFLLLALSQSPYKNLFFILYIRYRISYYKT